MILTNHEKPQSYHGLSLSEWGKNQGISYKTAWRMFREGRLPQGIEAQRLPTGTIRIRELEPQVKPQIPSAIIYARINPRQDARELDAQIALCKSFCAARGWVVSKTLGEIAPALGFQRRKLNRLLNPPPSRLVIWKRSILSRFDFELLSTCLQHCRCELVVIDGSRESKGEGGAMEDLVDAVSLICHRHYGVKRGLLILDEFRKVIGERKPKGV